MDHPAGNAHVLAVDIGARPPASGAEARAAQYCAEVLEEAGLETRLEPFEGLRSFAQIEIPILLATLAGAVPAALRRSYRLPAMALSGPALLAWWAERGGRARPISGMLRGEPSQNVVGILHPSADTRRRLILVAHADTPTTGWMNRPRFLERLRPQSMITFAAAASALAAWLLPRRLRRLTGTVSTAVSSAMLALVVQREVFGKEVDGANDNASGVGVMLSLAQTLSPLSHTEVWFVATGCNRSGRLGMRAFARRHSAVLDDCWVLGLDSVGGAETTLKWIASSSSDQGLERVAEEVSKAGEDQVATAGRWDGQPLDTEVLGEIGIPSMTLVAMTPDGRTSLKAAGNSDSFEDLDKGALDRCLEFVSRFVRQFDSYA